MSKGSRLQKNNSKVTFVLQQSYSQLDHFASDKKLRSVQSLESVGDKINRDNINFLFEQASSHLKSKEVESALLKYEACNFISYYN